MREKLIENKKTFEDEAYKLWRGEGADIASISSVISETMKILLDIANQLNEEDKLTTISYVRDAFADFEKACDNRDDYLLADCLYYEWADIVLVYIDLLRE